MQKTRTATLAIMAASALSLAAPHAHAQQAGTYNGHQANGQTYSVTVGTDSGNGKLAVTGFGLQFDGAACKPGGGTGGIGFGTGALADITNHKATVLLYSPLFYSKALLTFSGNTVTGTITTSEPNFAAFVPGGTKAPKKSVFCTAPSQTLTATLGAPAAKRTTPLITFY